MDEDRRVTDTLFAEVGGGSPEEVAAVASVIANLIDKYGLEKALKRFSSYTGKSPQYQKAAGGQMNTLERMVYERNKIILNQVTRNPQARLPYTHMENVNEWGDPKWASGMGEFKDIGRQRFYIEKSKPRVKAVQALPPSR